MSTATSPFSPRAPFCYRDRQLCCESVPLEAIASEVGTPVYVYSLTGIETRYVEHAHAFPDALIAYAYKANANPALCRLLAHLGAGADVVSGGELFIARQAGVPPERIVFNGNGKTRAEIAQALGPGVRVINVDAAEEVATDATVSSQLGVRAPVAVRVNPDIDAGTHPHIATGLKKSQFGVPIDGALEVYRRAAASPSLDVVGVHSHIGSQVTTVSPLAEAAERLAGLVTALRQAGVPIRAVNLGGGLASATRASLCHRRLIWQQPCCPSSTS